MRFAFVAVLAALIPPAGLAQIPTQGERSRICEVKPGCSVRVRPGGWDCSHWADWTGACSGGFITGPGVLKMLNSERQPMDSVVQDSIAGRPVGIVTTPTASARWTLYDTSVIVLCTGPGNTATESNPLSDRQCAEASALRAAASNGTLSAQAITGGARPDPPLAVPGRTTQGSGNNPELAPPQSTQCTIPAETQCVREGTVVAPPNLTTADGSRSWRKVTNICSRTVRINLKHPGSPYNITNSFPLRPGATREITNNRLPYMACDDRYNPAPDGKSCCP